MHQSVQFYPGEFSSVDLFRPWRIDERRTWMALLLLAVAVAPACLQIDELAKVRTSRQVGPLVEGLYLWIASIVDDPAKRLEMVERKKESSTAYNGVHGHG